MILVNIAEAKNHFTEYLRKVSNGSDVGICRRNVLIARITGDGTKMLRNKTRLGCGRGSATVSGDLTAPMMPESDWAMLGSGASYEPDS